MLSNADEDFLLDESSVLAFLADCDMVNEAPVRLTVSATSTPTQCDALATPTTWSDSGSSLSSPEKSTDKKKSWRQRRKEEVLHLREVVKQLSTELERLKMAAGVQSTLPNAVETRRSPRFVLKAHQTEASLMWEGVAGRQSTLRQSSEEKNAKLRAAVTHHLQQTKSLQRTIKRKLREDLVSSSMDLIRNNRLNTRGVTPPLNNKEVFDKLMAGLDGAYEGVDSFFQQTGMHQLSCPGRRNESARSRVSKGLFVEFLDSYALPFDLRQTTKAIWTPEASHSNDDNLFFLQVRERSPSTKLRMDCC